MAQSPPLVVGILITVITLYEEHSAIDSGPIYVPTFALIHIPIKIPRIEIPYGNNGNNNT